MTLSPEMHVDGHGHQLRYLPGTRAELDDQGGPPRLKVSMLDQALLEVASGLNHVTGLDYLLACWKRVSRQLRSMKSGSSDDPKVKVIREARRLCMSYCIFAFTMPEMFG